MGSNIVEANKLLDFSQQIDLAMLDKVVQAMHTAVGEEQKYAQDILTQLKGHPEGWTRVDIILEHSQNSQTKYYALQILEDVIKTRWMDLLKNPKDEEKVQSLKQLLPLVMSRDCSLHGEKIKLNLYLMKLLKTCAKILLTEKTERIPGILKSILSSELTTDALGVSRAVLLELLVKELQKFNKKKSNRLRNALSEQFQQIVDFCQFVMTYGESKALVLANLETLLHFLNWIPLAFIFETELIPNLIRKIQTVSEISVLSIKCLTKIAEVTIEGHDYRFSLMFTTVMEKLEYLFPMDENIRQGYSDGSQVEKQFIRIVAMFLCKFLKEHGSLVEEAKELLINALEYLINISEIDDIEIFKICLEYWNFLAAELYQEAPIMSYFVPGPRRTFYAPILFRIRAILISRMVKPEEVLIVENENGEVVREFMKDTDSINLYKNMRESLVYLTHLDCTDTERIMTKKLTNQVNGTEWSWKNLNSLCWAIGSISGAMLVEHEERFLATVIKSIHQLWNKIGNDNKALIASSVMYVAGQYPRFLRAHWKFLKTVVNILFEFMHETHDGVQDMACDTFIKIAQKCRRHFVTVQMGEVVPFIEEILSNTSTIICDLQPQQVHTFYEAVGYMISAQTNTTLREQLILKYMHLPNQVWDEIIGKSRVNVDVLKDMDAIKQLSSILKTNVRACKALAHPFSIQLGRIYFDMLNIYKVISANITQAITLNGEMVTKQPLIKGMRVIKKESLKLIQSWIQRSTNNELVLDNFIPPLLDAVLMDYKNTIVPSSREPEVLSTLAIIVNKLEGSITPHIPNIFEAVFSVTLDMISKDFHEFPEHRTNFYELMQAVNTHCFPALCAIPSPQFKLVMNCIFWATKHTMRNIAEIGLDILFLLLQNVAKTDTSYQQNFYYEYYRDTVQNILIVITASSISVALSKPLSMLANLIGMINTYMIGIPLIRDGQMRDNEQLIIDLISKDLKTAFLHLTTQQIKNTVSGLFNFNQDTTIFKEFVIDFLKQIRDFTGEDDSDLFLEEREKALMTAEAEKRKQQMGVPGIINPHDLPEEMQD